MGNATSGAVTCDCTSPFHKTAPTEPKSYPDFVSSPVEELHKEFMASVCALLVPQSLFWQGRRKDPPIRYRQPKDIYKFINVHLSERGTNHKVLLELLRRILYFTPAYSHPYFMYQMMGGLDPYAIIGDFVAAVSPSSMLSYKDAPVYHIMEMEISKKLRELVGYPENSGDCIFPPGCSIGNCVGMLLARQWKFPESKQRGLMHLPKLAMFASQDCHCSFQKGAIFTGVGMDNVIFVKTDDRGRMSVQHLIKCIDEAKNSGKVPLLVFANSGSYVFGAFDPLEDISRVCRQHGMWLHSDGALGGGLIVSEKQRHSRLKGIELCDSFSGSFHKMGSATQVSSYLLTPHNNILKETFGLGYRCEDFSSFNHEEEQLFHAEWDSYEKYMDHTRRPDISKLFMMWKGKGLVGLGANVDDGYERAKYLLEELKRRRKQHGKFVPLLEEFESPLVCFYYVPTYLQKEDHNGVIFKERLNMVSHQLSLKISTMFHGLTMVSNGLFQNFFQHTSFLLAELIRNGVMVISTQSIRRSPIFFKMTTFNSSMTKEDIHYLLDQIDNYGTFLRVPFEVPGDLVDADPDMNFLTATDILKWHE